MELNSSIFSQEFATNDSDTNNDNQEKSIGGLIGALSTIIAVSISLLVLKGK
ncbi:hypothetical protein Catovirus_2_14 [Catovirus CTV1]|uniref:Uncharacterized protein n=1 Tax=Catovirus CTV1 TaxID=1977631 RepID=A0A1V0SBH2_9VIRU|nr:hypothetical protein Catovirus_2_14 [Catovirus CTV1]